VNQFISIMRIPPEEKEKKKKKEKEGGGKGKKKQEPRSQRTSYSRRKTR